MTQAENKELQDLKTEVAVLSDKVGRLDETLSKIDGAIRELSERTIERIKGVEVELESLKSGEGGPREPCRSEFKDIRKRLNTGKLEWFKAWTPLICTVISACIAAYVAYKTQ